MDGGGSGVSGGSGGDRARSSLGRLVFAASPLDVVQVAARSATVAARHRAPNVWLNCQHRCASTAGLNAALDVLSSAGMRVELLAATDARPHVPRLAVTSRAGLVEITPALMHERPIALLHELAHWDVAQCLRPGDVHEPNYGLGGADYSECIVPVRVADEEEALACVLACHYAVRGAAGSAAMHAHLWGAVPDAAAFDAATARLASMGLVEFR